MDDGAVRAGLIEHFGALDSSLLNEALSTCRSYGFDADGYYFQWEAFVISHQPTAGAAGAAGQEEGDLKFTLETAKELRKQLQTSQLGRKDAKANGAAKDLRVNKVPGGAPGVKRGPKTSLGLGFDDELNFTPSANKTRPSTNDSLSKSGGAANSGGSRSSTGAFNTSIVKREEFATPARTNGSSKSLLAGSSPEDKKPIIPELASSTATKNTDAAFFARPDPMTIIESLNGGMPAAPARMADATGTSRISLSSSADPKSYNYRYMFEKLSARSGMLDTLIEEAAALLCAEYGVAEAGDEDGEGDGPVLGSGGFPSSAGGFGDPSIASQGPPIWAVGRLCAESSEGPTAKLSEKGCWLECSKLGGHGKRTPLIWDAGLKIRGCGKGAGGVSLFPGAIVAVKGRNGGGRYFGVSEVVTMPPVDPPLSYPEELIEHQFSPNKLDGEPLQLVVAAGPYTTEETLEYVPLVALIDELIRSPPDVLVLLGPFVDSQHPLLKSGQVDQFPAQIFRSRIQPLLADLVASSPSTSIILLPSPRDLISHHLAYPQSPFSRDAELGLTKKIKLLPNPAVFNVNEVAIAATSVDALMALRAAEWFRSGKDHEEEQMEVDGKDIIARSCRHIMRQRSFYPVFPPVSAPNLDPVNLDITHHDLLRYGPIGADLLIIPSSLTPFAKIVDSTVVINCGQVARGKRCFARIAVHPMDRTELEQAAAGMQVDGQDAELQEHRLYERCRVDLVRV